MRAHWGIVIVCLLSRTAAAAPVVIDFEGLADGATVIAQFSSKGISFNALTCIDYTAAGHPAGFAHSGTKGIEPCFAVELCSSPVEMTFTAPQRFVKVWAGLTFPPPDKFTVVLTAFDAQGAQVGQASADIAPQATPAPIATPIQVVTANQVITRADVTLVVNGQSTFTNGMAIDDVEFDTQGPPPVCTATQAPQLTLTLPVDGSTTQVPSFLLQGNISTGAPLESAAITFFRGDGTSTTGDLLGRFIQLEGGPFGPTRFSPLLPGSNLVRIAVANCKGTTTEEFQVTYEPLPAGARVALEKIEVIQSVQDASASVPLIAGKRTIARAYLHVAGPAGLHIQEVDGSLAPLHSDGSPVPGPGSVHSLNSVTLNGATQPGKQSDLTTTLNFELPPEWTADGTIHLEISDLRIDGVSPSLPCDGCTSSNVFLLPRADFHDAPPVRLTLFSVPYTVGTSTFMPTTNDFDHLESWLRRAYPTADVQVTRSSVSAITGKPGTDFFCDDVNATLSGLIDTCGCVSQVHFYGLVSDAKGFMRGCTKDIPGRVASGPAGVPSSDFAPWDTDGTYADWYGGHEIAHTYGRRHPGFCNGNSHNDDNYPYADGKIGGIDYGLDVGDSTLGIPMTVMPASDWSDVMTYCDFQWMSDYTYEGILQNLRDIEAGGGGGAVLPDALVVQGDLDPSGAPARLRPCWRLAGLIETPRPASSAFAIELRDGAGGTLAAYPFEPQPDSEALEGEVPHASFDLVVPWVDGTKRVSVVKAGAELAFRAVSARAPQVLLVSPNGTDVVLPTRSTLRVQWTAKDADGDKLTFGVHYSNDGGRHWEPLEMGLTGTQVDLAVSRLRGGAKCLFRVLVTDGVNTAHDDEDQPTPIPQKPPRARIFLPAGGAAVAGDGPLLLRGEGTDLEDGALSGNDLEWSSDVQGVLGHGGSLSVEGLKAGPHVITLHARDSDGGTDNASVSITVEPAPPVARADIAPTVTPGGTVALDGRGSTGPGVLTFDWALLSKPAGSKATVKDAGAALAGLVTDKPGQYSVQLTVTDSGGGQAVALAAVLAIKGTPFIRADVTGDGQVDISDPVRILGWLFLGDAEPECLEAADVNNDGQVDLSDAVGALSFLFTGGQSPPAPFPQCGVDPTSDKLGCNRKTCP